MVIASLIKQVKRAYDGIKDREKGRRSEEAGRIVMEVRVIIGE